MEKKLNALFDYHRFDANSRLGRLISETESRYAGALNDNELEMVSAAGVSTFDSPIIDDPIKGKI